jgi:hypothetical protein
MEINKFGNIKERMFNLDARDKNLGERGQSVLRILNEHNIRFEKLRKGYVALGLVNDKDSDQFEPIVQNVFDEEFEAIRVDYENIINGKSEIHEDVFAVNDASEKYISDLLTLTSNRWNTIIGFMKLWKNERLKLRESQLKLLEDLKALEKQDKSLEDTKLLAQATLALEKQLHLIEEQEMKITIEEEQQNELEYLIELREWLYSMAVKLFQQ